MGDPNKLAKYSPEQVQYLKECFVENECCSDEYRETQPQKGLRYVASLCRLLDVAWVESDPRWADVVRMIKDWTTALLEDDIYPGAKEKFAPGHGWPWYAGAKQLEPLLEMYFDYSWAVGEHPYDGDDTDAMDESLEWMER
jgi:hypothetical protein